MRDRLLHPQAPFPRQGACHPAPRGRRTHAAHAPQRRPAMITLWARDRLTGRHVKRKTREYLEKLEHGPVLASQSSATELLKQMAQEPGPKVAVGKTLWGEPGVSPLIHLVKACRLTTGGIAAA